MVKIGYKAVSKDMRAIRGNGMRFKENIQYTIVGDLIPCENGYHYCDTIEDVALYYPLEDSRIFKVEASGEIMSFPQDKVSVASSIKLLEEVTLPSVGVGLSWDCKKRIAK